MPSINIYYHWSWPEQARIAKKIIGCYINGGHDNEMLGEIKSTRKSSLYLFMFTGTIYLYRCKKCGHYSEDTIGRDSVTVQWVEDDLIKRHTDGT
jgi:hypothetical protein